MTSFSLHEKVSGHEIKAWYLASLVDTADGEAAWESFMDHKPEDFKVPKKPRVSKKSSTPAERADAEYMEDKCDARVYKGPSKGGWGCQCSCKKVVGQFLCKRHQTEADTHDGMVKNGFVTGDRPTHHYGDEESTLIPWHDVEVPTKVKAKKTSGEKKVSTRKCSCCGETGHNKSKCPNKSDSDSDSAKKNNKKDIAKMKTELAKAEAEAAEAEAAEPAAEAAEESEEVVGKKKKTKKNKKNKKKKSTIATEEQQPAEEVELDEDDDKTLAYGGEDIVDDKTVAYGGDVADMDDVKDEEDEEDKGEDIELEFEGVSYTRNTVSNVVCDDDFDEVGTWNTDTNAIVFSKLGEINHKHERDTEEAKEETEEEETEEE
jgi:hypothetical protein